MKNVILAAIFVIFLFGCVNQYQGSSNQSQGNANQANPTPAYGKLPSNYTVQLGDLVWVDYTLWVDSKVYDTNNATLANKSGIYNPQRSYVPLEFNASFDGSMIKGFVLNIVGLRINETLVFDVPPVAGYGIYDPTKVIVTPRYYERPLSESAPLAYFRSRGINISKGTMVSQSPLVFVENISNDTVTLYYMLSPGQQFTQNGITSKVLNASNTSATMELVFQNGSTYMIPNPQTGATTQFKVVNINDSSITLDANHPLANKTLTFKVTVLKIQHDNLISQ